MYFHMDESAAAVRQSGMRAVLGYGMVDGGNRKGGTESGTRKRWKASFNCAKNS